MKKNIYLFSVFCFFIVHLIFLFSVSQVTDLKVSVDNLEKERDFYFAKLRDIEILCQATELENDPVRILMNTCIAVSYFYSQWIWEVYYFSVCFDNL